MHWNLWWIRAFLYFLYLARILSRVLFGSSLCSYYLLCFSLGLAIISFVWFRLFFPSCHIPGFIFIGVFDHILFASFYSWFSDFGGAGCWPVLVQDEWKSVGARICLIDSMDWYGIRFGVSSYLPSLEPFFLETSL